MCVSVSCSFGLLGASGCGKTTLLRCILSSLDPEYGEITVLGMEPGIRSSHIPGRDVGYMPQVTSLYFGIACIFSISIGNSKLHFGFINTVVYFINYLLFKDVGLVVEFSAFELMMFFGALQHMPLKKIKERIKYLIELLEIPSLYQRIETMR